MGLEHGNNGFFGPKITEIGRRGWQERNVITFLDMSGRLPIGVTREDCWAQSIATGNRSFVEAVKRQMRSFAIGRRVRKKAEGFELRESQSPYKAFFDTGKNDIEGKNLWFWNE